MGVQSARRNFVSPSRLAMHDWSSVHKENCKFCKRDRGARKMCCASYHARKSAFCVSASALSSAAAADSAVTGAVGVALLFVFPAAPLVAGTVVASVAVVAAGAISRAAVRVMAPLRIGLLRSGERMPLGEDMGFAV